MTCFPVFSAAQQCTRRNGKTSFLNLGVNNKMKTDTYAKNGKTGKMGCFPSFPVFHNAARENGKTGKKPIGFPGFPFRAVRP